MILVTKKCRIYAVFGVLQTPINFLGERRNIEMVKYVNTTKEEWDFLTREYSNDSFISSVSNDLTKLTITITVTVVIIAAVLIIMIIVNKRKRK